MYWDAQCPLSASTLSFNERAVLPICGVHTGVGPEHRSSAVGYCLVWLVCALIVSTQHHTPQSCVRLLHQPRQKPIQIASSLLLVLLWTGLRSASMSLNPKNSRHCFGSGDCFTDMSTACLYMYVSRYAQACTNVLCELISSLWTASATSEHHWLNRNCPDSQICCGNSLIMKPLFLSLLRLLPCPLLGTCVVAAFKSKSIYHSRVCRFQVQWELSFLSLHQINSIAFLDMANHFFGEQTHDLIHDTGLRKEWCKLFLGVNAPHLPCRSHSRSL